MGVYAENGSIEVGIMVNEQTDEHRIGITLPNGSVILLNIEQSEDVINHLTALLAEIKAQPYRAVGTLQ